MKEYERKYEKVKDNLLNCSGKNVEWVVVWRVEVCKWIERVSRRGEAGPDLISMDLEEGPGGMLGAVGALKLNDGCWLLILHGN